MELSEAWKTIFGVGGTGLAILILGLIKIKPLEISVWSWLARKLGKAFNGETLDRIGKIEDRIDTLENSLNDHIEANKRENMFYCRQRILRFADEMYEGAYHSREHFEEMLYQMTLYENYCTSHPDFPNDKAVTSIKLIKEQYEECLRKHSFEMKKENEDVQS